MKREGMFLLLVLVIAIIAISIIAGWKKVIMGIFFTIVILFVISVFIGLVFVGLLIWKRK